MDFVILFKKIRCATADLLTLFNYYCCFLHVLMTSQFWLIKSCQIVLFSHLAHYAENRVKTYGAAATLLLYQLTDQVKYNICMYVLVTSHMVRMRGSLVKYVFGVVNAVNHAWLFFSGTIQLWNSHKNLISSSSRL